MRSFCSGQRMPEDGASVSGSSGADAQCDTILEQRSERAERLRHNRRMVAEGRVSTLRTREHTFRVRAERPEPCQREGRMAPAVPPRLKMVS